METLSTPPPQNQQQIPIKETSSLKQWGPLGILLVAAAIVGWQLGQPKTSTQDPGDEIIQEVPSSNMDGEQIASGKTDEPSKEQTKAKEETASKGTIRIQGTLLPSKDPNRGNVILKTGDSETYLWTSKELAPLINQTVVVEGNGSMERFTITNISIAENK